MGRVVITGLGGISALGLTAAACWESHLEGKTGIGPYSRPRYPERIKASVAAEIQGFEGDEDPSLRSLDRFAQLALVAAREAIARSGLEFSDEELALSTATILGSGLGGLETLEDAYHRNLVEGKSRVSPLTVPRAMPSAGVSAVSMAFGLRGPAYATTSACSSATHAIGSAFHLVRSGAVPVAVTGGSEALVVYGNLKAWEGLRVMSNDTCRPFSKNRSGMVLGEGAAVFVLEDMDRARRRGAEILGEVVGFGMRAEAGDMVAPCEDTMARTMRAALSDGRLDPGAVGYVNAHGTATFKNDPSETAAIRAVFGAHADRLLVSSTKGAHGHALGASGALELLATVEALRHGVVPPTVNFTEPDPACDLDYVPNEAREQACDVAISNSFAFGGLSSCLAVRRFQA